MRAGLAAAAGVLAAVLLWAGWLSGLPRSGGRCPCRRCWARPSAWSCSARASASIASRATSSSGARPRAVRGADRAGRRHAGLSRGVRRLRRCRAPIASRRRAYRAGERGLAVGAFVFGLGMRISGSCISAHSTASARARRARPSRCWGRRSASRWALPRNTLYLSRSSRAVIAAASSGYGGSALRMRGAGGAGVGVARLSRPEVAARDGGDATADAWQVALRLRWPAAAGGLAVAFIAVIAYLRVALGGPPSWAAWRGGFDAGWLPARWKGWTASPAAPRRSSRRCCRTMACSCCRWWRAPGRRAGGGRVQAQAAVGGADRRNAGGVLMGWGAHALGCTWARCCRA